jgi:hypothetical protein
MLYSIHPTKRRMSARIAKLTEEYLARGGVIEKLPSVHYYPIPSMKWIADKGMDYTSWERWGFAQVARNADQLEQGCYVTLPKLEEE